MGRCGHRPLRVSLKCVGIPQRKSFFRQLVLRVVLLLCVAGDLFHFAGVKDEQIILDPGVGFGKTYEHNLMAIRHLDRLTALGYPVLLATSRKSVIGLTLDLPTDERVEGTMVTTVYGVQQHAAFVRVHDVKENMRAIRMTQAIMRAV